MNIIEEIKYLKIQCYKIKVRFQKFLRKVINLGLYQEVSQENQEVNQGIF